VISASAPGKVVLSGEYAVLAGAPALVLAVDRRVSLDLEIIDDNRWRFSSNGFSAQASHRLTDLTGTTRVAPSDPAAICQSILRTLAQTGVDLSGLPRGLNVSIDSRPLFYAGHKLGLGSSAAVTVVLTQGMLKLTKGGAEPFTAMLAAHRVMQGGRGSGVDVAAALPCSRPICTIDFSGPAPAPAPRHFCNVSMSGAAITRRQRSRISARPQTGSPKPLRTAPSS
jgi:mevalonate kinase